MKAFLQLMSLLILSRKNNTKQNFHLKMVKGFKFVYNIIFSRGHFCAATRQRRRIINFICVSFSHFFRVSRHKGVVNAI